MWRFFLPYTHRSYALLRFVHGGHGAQVANHRRRRRREEGGRPHSRHPKDAGVGGGGERQLTFRAVPSMDVNMRVESQVESFLKQERQELQLKSGKCATNSSGKFSSPIVRVMNVPGNSMKRAVLDFCVRGRKVQAVGQSTRAKKAKALCCMHAAQLIDHFSIDGADHSTAPLPLEEERVFGHGNGLLSRGASPPRHSSTPSHPDTYERWEDYVKDCEQYVEEKEKFRCSEAYARLRIPSSGNPLIDRAAEMTELAGSTNRLALQTLNNKVHNATKDINLLRISQRVFVATLVLDSTTQLTATGVGSTSKEAKQRVAMHALNIIKLVMEQQGHFAPQGSTPAGRGSCSSSDAISLSLTPRYGKMLEFFTLLFGVVPDLTFTKQGACYTCHLDLDGVKCTGSGVNRFEAERAAIENVLSEMELYDERLQGINSVISRYPNIQPHCIPTAKLSTALRDDIRSFVQRRRADFHLLTERAVNGDDGSSDNIVDVETQATIKALEEAVHDRDYASRMREKLCSLRANPVYLERFHARRSGLSIASVEKRIMEVLQHHSVVVVCGTTGCGKTTQVPQYILDHEIMAERGDRCSIVVTQPRRLSAFSVAERIASERLVSVGGDVGYAVRLDARPGRHITLCTSGVLLQMLSAMPSLDAISHLIIDEVHERDINCDVILALVKEILENRNKRLKVILMSATLQSDMFASYFGNIPVISVEGAVYPVKERYLDDIANLFRRASSPDYYSQMFDILDNSSADGKRRGKNGSAGLWRRKGYNTVAPKTDYNLIARLIERSVEVDLNNNVTGKSVLVFLPGWKELMAAKQAIEGLTSSHRYHIILLHSSVDAAKQRECFAPAPKGKIKVVLATNIAESGITIDDAAVVIDTGLIKQTTWISREKDLHHRLHASSYATQLVLQYASRANCTQRKGRAGRTQGGVCYRLFTRDVWDALPSFQEAEIHRVPLAQVLLKLLSLGHANPKETLGTFIEPPSESHVEVSMRQLQSLGAVTSEERLTPLGLYLSRLPCDPRVGKMIMMGAVLRCLDSALTMAATGDISPFLASRELSFEIRQRRHMFSMRSQSDHISVLNAYNTFCTHHRDANFARENFLHMSNLKLISRYKQQYRDILRRSGFIRNGESSSVGFYDEDSLADDGTISPTPYVDSGPLSVDASDVSLVKACLCAALSPNVAVLDPSPLLQGGKNVKTLVMRTPTHAAISPSKDSACRRLGPPRTHGVLTSKELLSPDEEGSAVPPVTPSMLYIYQDIFGVKESREEFLTQVSSVSLWALLLFGVGEAEMMFDSQLQLCIVGNWIGIHIDSETFSAISELRSTLHACVWQKYKHPDDTENNKALDDLRLLCKAILKHPPNEKEQHTNRLVDTGRIVSPTQLEPLGKPHGESDYANMWNKV